MKLIVKKKDDFSNSDVVVIFLTEGYRNNIEKDIPSEFSFITERVDLSFFMGKSSEVLFLPFIDFPNIIIIGIGKEEEINSESLRNSSSDIVKICKNKNVKAVSVLLPLLTKLTQQSILSSIAEGLYLSNYNFDKYKSKEDDANKLLDKAFFYFDTREIAVSILKDIEISCENTILCRDMINETSDKTNPVEIAKVAKGLSKINGITCEVYGRQEIEKMKMGLILAVSRGSVHPPQLVVLKYKGNPKSKKSIAIVGKGITFDSGGMNLKSSSHIEDMRCDMSGAAACIYTIKAAAEMKIKKNIFAIIPLCENMISNTAYRPGDVFYAYNGKSVEIGNTDAEGRLILADALAYTEEKLKPDYIIDIATLTGACLVCFGETIAGLLTNNDNLAEIVCKAGEETGDRAWRLPLYKEFDEEMKSDIADIKNISSNRNAGTIMGAVFLKSFIQKTYWAHIDIAGTAWYSKQRGYRPKYATGFGVRLFLEMIKGLDF
ncbi:MAG: leucyl aminopeptidase [Spirochaetota bacterium]|nr:leucyl aminopeptidase [Spirochaetota bacterium]